MAKVEDVKVLNIDDVPYAVDSMSDEVQQMVAIFNEWNQQEADVRNQLALVQAAKNDLSRRIILQVRKEKEEAEAEAGENVTAEAVAASEGSEVPTQ